MLSGEGNGNPLQYSCLENPIDKGAWWATGGTRGCKELDTTERLTHGPRMQAKEMKRTALILRDPEPEAERQSVSLVQGRLHTSRSPRGLASSLRKPISLLEKWPEGGLRPV